MSVRIQIDKFDGPLDLLLQLVEQEELAIREVSLAQVTDQYLEHLEHTSSIPTDELADFLVIAARLLYLKSRLLVPSLPLPAEEQAYSLEAQLRMYKAYADASRGIEALLKLGRVSFAREKAPIVVEGFFPPKTLTSLRLAQVFRDILRTLEPVVRFPKAAIERAVSIEEKMSALRMLLKTQGSCSFHTFVRGATSKTDIVVSFLALLELVKQRFVQVSQDELFTDISVSDLEQAGSVPALTS